MLKFTNNYVFASTNFVVKNLYKQYVISKESYVASLIQNILLRGKVISPSPYLKKKIGDLSNLPNYFKLFPLVSMDCACWNKTILGDNTTGYKPAKYLYDVLLPKTLDNLKWTLQYLRPEVPLSEVLGKTYPELLGQRVDFFMPHIKTVIEVDGSQHNDMSVKLKDNKRDGLLLAHGIPVIRITTKDIQEESSHLKKCLDIIRKKCQDFFFHNMHFAPVIELMSNSQNSWVETEKLIPTRIIRFQHVVLECIRRGIIKPSSTAIELQLKTREPQGFAELACLDLIHWWKIISNLTKESCPYPDLKVSYCSDFDIDSKDNKVFIDFSLNKWDDADPVGNNIIVCRSDGIDLYVNESGEITPHDHFYTNISSELAFKIKLDEEGYAQTDSLKYLLQTIFSYEDFQPGQLQIISNILSGYSTIGILPTSGGKSLCYQIPSILRGGTTVVVCPIKALMEDQKTDLNELGINRVAVLTSDRTSEEKEIIFEKLINNKLQFLFVSPERLQMADFRQALSAVKSNSRLSYVVIDEAHCMSEWGHDFRTSYLNLSNSFKLLDDDIIFIALTATATARVLKDIQIEFEIEDFNVKTINNYSRSNLNFSIVNSSTDKFTTCANLLADLKEHHGYPDNNSPDKAAGLIFTPFTNHDFGCYGLSNQIFNRLKINSEYYCGSSPKGITDEYHEKHKIKVQKRFKNNEFPLLVATKAFGMGINKKNIKFTIHYGIPSSLEAFYQEAGRAGRDGNKALCYLLFTKTKRNIDFILDEKISIEQLKNIQNNIYRSGGDDLSRQLLLILKNSNEPTIDFLNLVRLFEYIKESQDNEMIVSSTLLSNISNLEKNIYRLQQLGVVVDWTVEDFFRHSYKIKIGCLDPISLMKKFELLVLRYEVDSNFKHLKIKLAEQAQSYINGYAENDYQYWLAMLISWVNGYYFYNRKRSLYNIYKLCESFRPGQEELFREKLEGYFRINNDTLTMQAIADQGLEVLDKIFELLYQSSEQGQTLRSTLDFQKLKMTLARFLESYQHNIGLNILNLLYDILCDIESDNETTSKADIALNLWREHRIPLDRLLDLGCLLSQKQKIQFSKFLCRNSKTLRELESIHETLKDDYSLIEFLRVYNVELNTTSNRIFSYVE